ncbi:hypothetical protein ACWC6I_34605 [Streptomyces sp. NPDC001414]
MAVIPVRASRLSVHRPQVLGRRPGSRDAVDFPEVVVVAEALLSWPAGMKAEQAGVERADRWGIFVGAWERAFIGLGLALSHYEQQEGTLTGLLHAVKQSG